MLRLLLSLVCILHTLTTHAAIVAVASNFAPPFEAIIKAFEVDHPELEKLEVVYGASGKLYAQILHGAPFALFLSADDKKTVALQHKGLVQKAMRKHYASGRLALMVSQDHDASEAFGLLQRGVRVVMANPKLAPYGYASEQVLQAWSESYSTTMEKRTILYAENIAQAYHFVDVGGVELGFVAYTHIIDQALEKERYLLVSDSLHDTIRQEVVVLKDSNNKTAHALYHFLSTTKAQAIIERYGYALP